MTYSTPHAAASADEQMAASSEGAAGRRHKPALAILGTRGYPSYYGGFETAVRRLAPYLADQGWNVTVYGRPGQTAAADTSLDTRVKRVETIGLNSKKASTLSYGLTSALHAFVTKPDVVLVMNCANGFWLPLLKLRGIRTAVNVDGMEWERAKWGRFARAIFKMGARLTARFADVIICDARAIADRWRTEFKRESAVIAYGGDPVESPHAPLGLPHRGYALVVARFVPENSISEFFEAVPEIANHMPVVIVGSSGYDDEYDAAAKALAASSQNVRVLGHLSDDALLHSLWAHSGAYFHGHSVGGTNPALVQAMACGAPIVARDTVFNREVLGKDALFTAPDPEAIRQNILTVAKNTALAEALSAGARDRARDAYSWGSICEAYDAVAQKLLLHA